MVSIWGDALLLIWFKTLLWQPAGAHKCFVFAGKLSHSELLWSRCEGWWNLSLTVYVSLSSFHRLFKASKAENGKPPPLPPPRLPAHLSPEGEGAVCVCCSGRKVVDSDTEVVCKICETSFQLALQRRRRCKVSGRLLGYLIGGWTVKTCRHVAFPADWLL